MRWTVLIPAKSLPEAKSRLAPMSADAETHRRLVEAIRADTVEAARAAAPVARVLVVADRGVTGPGVLVQVEPGLNAAVREGAAHAARTWPDDGVAALVGDLPALRSDELAAALEIASTVSCAFAADAAGTGTTLLTVTPGHDLVPEFGVDSAQRHGVRAQPLPAGPGLRQDVDTEGDLVRAVSDLGVGPATRAALADRDVTVRSTSLGMIGP